MIRKRQKLQRYKNTYTQKYITQEYIIQKMCTYINQMLKGRVPWPGKSFERARKRPHERNHAKNIKKVNALKCVEEYYFKKTHQAHFWEKLLAFYR